MNKSKSIIAIMFLAIVATAVAFVSCKKDNENAPNTKAYTVQQAADIRQMEDPLAYMKDFKKKLTESKDNEAFNLDDAAWHLACLANLDFCNVNVEYDDFQFDTLEMQVNVTDGVILLGDLRAAYEQMCTEILQFKKGFIHSDQNLYYINVAIDTEDHAKVALMSSYNTNSKFLGDHAWYFEDIMDAVTVCDELFDTDTIYYWDTLTTNYITYILNLFEHHENYWSNGNYVQCYFPTRKHSFDYQNYWDPFESYYYNNSRVFAIRDHNSDLIYDFAFMELCYCVDSYLGLGYDYISSYTNEVPVCWKVKHCYHHDLNSYWHYHYHKLNVDYGQLITPNPPGPSND